MLNELKSTPPAKKQEQKSNKLSQEPRLFFLFVCCVRSNNTRANFGKTAKKVKLLSKKIGKGRRMKNLKPEKRKKRTKRKKKKKKRSGNEKSS
jgi:hypothetical protein